MNKLEKLKQENEEDKVKSNFKKTIYNLLGLDYESYKWESIKIESLLWDIVEYCNKPNVDYNLEVLNHKVEKAVQDIIILMRNK